jgi:phenylacetic acid degradation operon negative regulatory protein
MTRGMAPRSTQELLLTLFGDYLLEREEPVWVGYLIDLLATLEVSGSSVRTSLSRMVGKGWLETRREGRRSYYRLTPNGRELLLRGGERIHRPPRKEPWDGKWSVVTYSIPEDRRELRDKLRVRLAWLGCGALGNGVWISPHDVAGSLAEIGGELGMEGRIHAFRGPFQGPGREEEMIQVCWELSALERTYENFVVEARQLLKSCVDEKNRFGRLCPAQSFLRRLNLIHEYRQFPLRDPYLPRNFLPEAWSGDEAAELFEELHDLLGRPARRHVNWVLAGLGRRGTA